MTPSDLPDPEKTFDLVGLCPAPESDYLLWEYKCRGCSAISEGASWNHLGVYEQEINILSQKLLNRYRETVDDFASAKTEQRVIKDRPVEFMGAINLEARAIDLAQNHFRDGQIIVPIGAIALGRAIRKAAMTAPGRLFGCTIGSLDLIASFDMDVNTFNLKFPHAMH